MFHSRKTSVFLELSFSATQLYLRSDKIKIKEILDIPYLKNASPSFKVIAKSFPPPFTFNDKRLMVQPTPSQQVSN